MTPEHDERLGRIDQELCDALRTAPPSDLLPRVRARLASTPVEPPSRLPWIAAAVFAAAGVLVLSIAYQQYQTPKAHISTAVRASRTEPQPSRDAPPYAPPKGSEAKSPPERRAAAAVGLEIVRPSSDLQAIGEFVAALEEGLVDSGSLADPVEREPLGAIAIAPLSIEPLDLNE